MNKIIWKILLFIGIIPFILTLLLGINNMLTGFSGICFGSNCPKISGLSALLETIFIIFFVFWPFHLIGFILIIISVIKIKKR